MKPSNQQLKPTENPSASVPNTDPEMTLGLPADQQDWAKPLAWAKHYEVIGTIGLIVDAAYLAPFTTANLRHFLNFISQSQSRRLLERWRLFDPVADLLAHLNDVLAINNDIFQVLPPPSTAPAKKQKRGRSSTLYLLGMIIASSPASYSPKELADFHALKLWVLIQLLKQATEGIYQEAYMVDLSNRICQCEDFTHEFAVSTIKSILPGVTEYTLISHMLGQKAQRVLQKSQHDSAQGQSVRHFLRNVVKLAAGETGKKGKGPGQEGQVSWFSMFGGDLSEFEPVITSPTLPDTPEDEESSIHLSMGEDDDLLVIDLRDVASSLAELEVCEQDFLARDAEAQQYLPWSWQNLNPIELRDLDAWINRMLESAQFPHRLLGAVTWVARACARSLDHVLQMKISAQPDIEWAWDQGAACLHRIPPKRSNAWQPNDAQKGWVIPVAERLEYSLPPKVQSIIAWAIQRNTSAITLGELWSTSDKLPHKLFRKLIIGSGLGRIHPGMIATILPVKCYMSTGNGTQARLFGAHSIRGLPGACAYPSFLGTDLHGFFTTTDTSEISLGSRLDPLDTLLRRAIANATHRLEKIRSDGNLIQYHNHLITYLREVVLAASGMRPIKDLIDSPRWIDDKQAFLYVDDKSGFSANQGRLVPLPEHLVHYFRHDYARYLKSLALAIEGNAPRTASEIQSLSEGTPSKKIPYLFLLTIHAGKLGWKSASTENTSALNLFDWPLPDNLFRHRLVDRLLRSGISQEIVDGTMGHLMHNTASYGPYSPRSWAEDRKVLQPATEAAFSDLRFKLPRIGRKLPSLGPQIEREKPLLTDQFGKTARRSKRRQINQRAYLEANTIIDIQLGTRNLTELEESELQALAQKLCLNPDSTPHREGLKRYAHFQRRLHAAWNQKGKQIRTGRRLYSGGYREESLFLPEAVYAQHLYKQLYPQVPVLARKVLQTSRSRNKDAALLAMLTLCLENRISNTKLLTSILGKKATRLIIYQKRAYLEYAPELSSDLTRGTVQRIPVNAFTAELLDTALGQKQSYSLDSRTPTYLKALIKPMQASGHLGNHPTLRAFTKALASLVGQYNLQTLPAVSAAILSGTITTYSLTWEDLLRLSSGQPAKIGYKEDGDFPEPSDRNGPPLYGVSASQYLNDATFQANAKAFFDKLRAQIPPSTEESKWSSKEKRQQLARQIIHSMQPQAAQVSSTILLLGKWIAYLIRQKARGKRDFLSFNSLRRYLTSLSVPFTQLGFMLDLANADEEEVTKFYCDSLELGNRTTRSYRAKRISDFHRWARTEGVAEPEWSEIPTFPTTPQVAPGLITESEYLQVFSHLQSQTEVPHRMTDIQAFVWLCGYRYGVRDHEAFYLRGSDWVRDGQGKPVLLVRRNRRRRLKTDPSRRQVPCLYELTEPELELIERMVPYNKRYHDWETAPFVLEDQWQTERWRVRSGILSIIKTVTGNSMLGIHHARHSAGNQVGAALYQPQLPDYWQAFLQNSAWQQQTRLTLLGRDEHSRRSSWAGCRYLGHSRPKTSLESYWHFMLDWIWALIPINNQIATDISWQHAIALEEHIEWKSLEPPPPTNNAYRPATPQRLLDLCQYLTNGLNAKRAAQILQIDPTLCAKINHLLESLGRKMLRGIRAKYNEEKAWNEHPIPHSGFLQHITFDGWRRLSTLCETYPKDSLDIDIDLDTLDRMIGASRHLLMWTDEQFPLVSRFVHHYHLPDALYQTVIRSASVPVIKDIALEAGFIPISQSEAKKPEAQTDLQIDTVRLGNGRSSPDIDRCAIVTKKNSEFLVHNAYELSLLFIVWKLGETGTE